MLTCIIKILMLHRTSQSLFTFTPLRKVWLYLCQFSHLNNSMLKTLSFSSFAYPQRTAFLLYEDALTRWKIPPINSAQSPSMPQCFDNVCIEQIEVRECLLLFGAESFVLQVSIQKLKDKDIYNYNFACGFVWV